jgi:hypothetical protein
MARLAASREFLGDSFANISRQIVQVQHLLQRALFFAIEASFYAVFTTGTVGTFDTIVLILIALGIKGISSMYNARHPT